VPQPRGRAALAKPLAVAAIAVFSLGLGLFQLLRTDGLHAILEYDDGVWFGTTMRIVGGAIPYRDFVLDQPPLVPLLLAPVGLLARTMGAAGAFGVARVVTVVVEAVNVVLLGRLLRYRSTLCVAVACAVMAVYPAAVVTSRTVLLEPYCDLWCLLGLLAAFDGGRLSTDRRRIALAGAAFGAACACKTFAVLPLVVLLAQLWARQGTAKCTAKGAALTPARAASRCLGYAAGTGLVICSPFLVVAPGAFIRQVVLTQLERGAAAMADHWSRVAELVGAPPAPNSGAPDRFEHLVIAVVVAVVCLALVATWGAARQPSRASLERYGVVGVVVTGAGLAWPAAFYYHYAAFLAPFIALPIGVAAEVLSHSGALSRSLARSRALVVGGACAVMVVGAVHAVRIVQTDDQPQVPDVAAVERAVPKGSCTVSDNPAVLLLADRFSAPSGCSDLVDSDGSTLTWSRGKRGSGATTSAAAITDWIVVFEHTDYLLLTGGLDPGRIPWDGTLLDYLHSHFREASDAGGIVVWARET
jgi:hypothetical protein